MNQLWNKSRSCIAVATLGLGTVILLLTGCVSAPSIQSDRIPAGSLRLAQVITIGTRKEILENKMLRDGLLASGIRETEVKDGSVGLGRVYCCGGPKLQPTVFYVPTGIPIKLGDIVEVRIGHPQEKRELGELNTVTRVRQQAADVHGSVQWNPPDERLWRRTLYADWMPGEGWVFQGGLWSTWYKPPSKEKP